MLFYLFPEVLLIFLPPWQTFFCFPREVNWTSRLSLWDKTEMEGSAVYRSRSMWWGLELFNFPAPAPQSASGLKYVRPLSNIVMYVYPIYLYWSAKWALKLFFGLLLSFVFYYCLWPRRLERVAPDFQPFQDTNSTLLNFSDQSGELIRSTCYDR